MTSRGRILYPGHERGPASLFGGVAVGAFAPAVTIFDIREIDRNTDGFSGLQAHCRVLVIVLHHHS